MKKVTQWYTEGGKVDFEAVRLRIAQAGTHLRGAGADEAPEVYKKLAEVLAHHGSTVKIIHTIRPLIVCMARGGVRPLRGLIHHFKKRPDAPVAY